MPKTRLFLWAVLGIWLYAGLTVRYGLVWQDEVTLGLYASARAPIKPRPHLNLAVALMERQRFEEAGGVLDYTASILDDPSVTLSTRDASDAAHALQTNRLALSRLTDRGFSR